MSERFEQLPENSSDQHEYQDALELKSAQNRLTDKQQFRTPFTFEATRQDDTKDISNESTRLLEMQSSHSSASTFDIPMTPMPGVLTTSASQKRLSGLSVELPPSMPIPSSSVPTSPVEENSEIDTSGTSAIDKAPLANSRVLEQAQQYMNWLKQQSGNAARQKQADIDDYIQEATTTVKVGKDEIAPFAPFRPELSALQTFKPKQIVVLCLLAACWLTLLFFFHLEALTALIAIITCIYTLCLMLNLIMAITSSRSSSEEHIDDELVHLLKQAEWPQYTVLCPLYKEVQIASQFVQAMQALDYPQDKLQILFLTEENDRETRATLRAMSLPANFEILVVPDGMPRTKPCACNYGLLHATGTYTVIYDAEDIPDPFQLKKAVLAFANADLQTVCVQAKLNFYNSTQNLLTRWFTAEYSAWFEVILPGLQATNFALPLGGTSNHFRTASLRALGAWDAYNVTEDCDLGLRIKRFKMKTIILDSTTLEEANPNLKNWLRQRSRWIKGYMQTYLVHMRTPLKSLREGRIYDFFSFQIVVGSGTGLLFFNPLMWLLLALYMTFRAKVMVLYHVFFPGPILYMGAFCLIFGNLFYVYIYLLACTKRKNYHLVFWSLFIPLYWLLISIAGVYAFIELLVKPHYWQKTVHGLHMKGARQEQSVQAVGAFNRAHTQSIPAIRAIPQKGSEQVVRTITATMKAITTLPLPALSVQQKQAMRVSEKTKVRDPWFLASFVLSCSISIATCFYYFQHHDLLLYKDALSHMRLARSTFDSLTPGLAQLGGVWLPLPQILMWPFIWNDYLWQTGLAGAFAAMPCYVIAAVYLFLTIRYITKNSLVSFLGIWVFLLNLNILYLETTPLSELVCIATFVATGYYFIVWSQNGKTRQLFFAGIAIFLATLARYDGWALSLLLFMLVPIISWLRKQSWKQIVANMILFGILSNLGIVLWMVWCTIILGDPLYFQRGQFSAQSQQQVFIKMHMLSTLRNFPLSLQVYSLLSVETLGRILTAFAVTGLVVFLIQNSLVLYKEKSKAKFAFILATLAFLSPFTFYILSLYTGQAIIWLPEAHPQNSLSLFFNDRYGAQIVAPAALFIGIFLHFLFLRSKKYVRSALSIVFIALVVFQALLVNSSGIVSFQSGNIGIDCKPFSAIDQYFAEHYNGGRILIDTFNSDIDEAELDIDLRNIVYDGSGDLWKQALLNPATTVDWVVANPGDLVSKNINTKSPAFLKNFALVVNVPGSYLYHKVKLPPLPKKGLPINLLNEHRACKNT